MTGLCLTHVNYIREMTSKRETGHKLICFVTKVFYQIARW